MTVEEQLNSMEIEEHQESIVVEERSASVEESIMVEQRSIENPTEVEDPEVVHHEQISVDAEPDVSPVANKENRQSSPPPTTPAAPKKSVKVEE